MFASIVGRREARPPIYGLKNASTVSVKTGRIFLKIAVKSVSNTEIIKDKEWYMPIFFIRIPPW